MDIFVPAVSEICPPSISPVRILGPQRSLKNCYGPVPGFFGKADGRKGFAMLTVAAVGEVESRYIHSCDDHFAYCVNVVTGRTDGTDYSRFLANPLIFLPLYFSKEREKNIEIYGFGAVRQARCVFCSGALRPPDLFRKRRQ